MIILDTKIQKNLNFMKLLKLYKYISILLIIFSIDAKSLEKDNLNSIILSDNECKDFKNLEQIDEIKPFIEMARDINKYLTYKGMINISKLNYENKDEMKNIIQRKDDYSEIEFFNNFYRLSSFLKYSDICLYKEKAIIIKKIWSDIPNEYLEDNNEETLYENTINYLENCLVLFNIDWDDIRNKHKE